MKINNIHMRKLLLLTLVFGFAFGVQAQDDKAKEILNAVSEKTKTYKTIYAKFKSKLINKESGLNESQTGKISIKGDKYKIELGDQIVFCNGTKVWTYIKSEKACYESYVSEDDDDQISPSQIFTIWETGYKYKYVSEQNVNGKEAHVIKLFPKDPKNSKFHTIILSINKDYSLNTIEIRGKDGTIMKYIVEEMLPNRPMEDADFVFLKSKYPGVRVIEN